MRLPTEHIYAQEMCGSPLEMYKFLIQCRMNLLLVKDKDLRWI